MIRGIQKPTFIDKAPFISIRCSRTSESLQNLDRFSVYICYMHNRESTDSGLATTAGSLPRSASFQEERRSCRCIVTGCVDRINLNSYKFDHEEDLLLDGHVSWTGNTSLEVTMRVFQMVFWQLKEKRKFPDRL